MAFYSKDIDTPFFGAGSKPGIEIWCIDKLKLVTVPKSSYGKFFSGSTYVILNTVLLRNDTPQYDIHYWIGNEADQSESVLASDKALELDEALGSYAVQYREVQGRETEKFLSYFKPCIIPMEGVYSSKNDIVNKEVYNVSLLSCNGDHVVHVKEVPFVRSSLNHNDVFILDTASKIFLFSGCNSSIQERAKALGVVQYIKEKNHGGNCEVATIDDGKFVGDSDVGEFWSLFGGYAPIPNDIPSVVEEKSHIPSVKLFWITLQGKLNEIGSDDLDKRMLISDKCYMLDGYTSLFIWMGKNTSITERKSSISIIEEFVRSQGRSTVTNTVFLTEGSETTLFRSYFKSWPQTIETRLYEEGRGKVAALFKQNGYDVKELPEEQFELLIDCNGTLKVWHVDGDDEVTLLTGLEQKRLYSGDCYIVQYTYNGNRGEENLFYTWIGQSSVTEDRDNAIAHTQAIVNSIKGDPVLAQIFEGKEPLQFLSIFRTLIVLKGGNSLRYKKSVVDKGFADDETYNDSKTALFRVQGTHPDNMQAIQVLQVSGSLNSSYCYILKSDTSVFTWLGNLSSSRDHDLVDRMLYLINPSWQPILVREGSETELFWDALGGKTEYPKEKETKEFVEDPHLFTCNLTNNGQLKVKEIFNFSQDDLVTEGVLALDCYTEIYVWVGRHSSIKSKQEALVIGQKFVETDILAEGLSLNIPIYIVTEGYEPSMFTQFFEWDPSKANMIGNSFERKLAILKGRAQEMEAPLRNGRRTSLDTTPDSLRNRSGTPRNLSPASNIISGLSLNGSGGRRFSSPSSFNRKPSSESVVDLGDNANNLVLDNQSEDDGTSIAVYYPYDQVKLGSENPANGIDITKRETYLSHEEFQEKFQMPRRAFYGLPKWKQNKLKMSLQLF
ncbi:villin-1 [Impatiens glandulifera]|uniref:villin-1 n=1 Tax=Impatiens glandulifera TaxID=253017 RepID=UPI001FB0AA88|nr:villin-1 [Impatiens glandulifera]XP_047307892.1 villin-1 [Impatiens glandulifera]XP_047307893.1 villin-1 [Impatiens glandulifera]